MNVSFEEPVLMKMREMAKEKGWPFSRVVNDICKRGSEMPEPGPDLKKLTKEVFR